MSWKQRLQKVLLQIIFIVFNIGTVFGLTTFYFSKGHKSFVDCKFLSRYCKFMGLAFFVFYPLSVLTLLVDVSTESMGITDLARNSVYIGNWLLCTLIFFNQTLYSSESCNLYNQAGVLYSEITKNQYQSFSNDDANLFANLSAKCVLKTCFLALGFFLINIGKYYFRFESRLSLLEAMLFIYLFIPGFIMVLASNRFYLATTFCLYLIIRINNSIESVGEAHQEINEMRNISEISWRKLSKRTTDKINNLAQNHMNLHKIFFNFNRIYSKYIVFIVGFCFVNVVFEVKMYLQFSKNKTIGA